MPQLVSAKSLSEPVVFRPFYERVSLFYRILLALIVGSAFFLAHWSALRSTIYKNYGWMLGPMIICAPLLLYYATYTFRNLLSEMGTRRDASHGGSPRLHPTKAIEYLNDRRFLQAGLFFGVLNILMGAEFGIPIPYRTQGVSAIILTYVGFFIVGFACGLPAQGIYGVIRTIRSYAGETLKLDYTDPDGCGGMGFIGTALVKFSCITMIMGVFIAWYIVHTKWTGHSVLVQTTKASWIAFPFIMAFLVLVVPTKAINEKLRQFKVGQVTALQAHIDDIRSKIDGASVDEEKLEHAYEYYTRLRAQLYKMRVWPYDLTTKMRFIAVLFPNIVIAIINADSEWHFVFVKLWSFIVPHRNGA